MKNVFTIREATLTDIPELSKLCQETILTVNARDYEAAEVDDWSSCCKDEALFIRSFAEQHYLVAVDSNRKLVGFGSINEVGYMHMLYVHKSFQQQGVATLLYRALEQYAVTQGAQRITSEVSITARGFFKRVGFSVDQEQKRKANKLLLTNFKMSKDVK